MAYICICNAINERSIHAAIDAGAQSASDVYAHVGVAPQCGLCANEFERMIDERFEALRHAAE
jgi:bacterioferritin-associated ferredoxin